jgi:hypothetical protein
MHYITFIAIDFSIICIIPKQKSRCGVRSGRGRTIMMPAAQYQYSFKFFSSLFLATKFTKAPSPPILAGGKNKSNRDL